MAITPRDETPLLTSASPSVGFIQNHLDESFDSAFADLGVGYDLKLRQFVPLPVASGLPPKTPYVMPTPPAPVSQADI